MSSRPRTASGHYILEGTAAAFDDDDGFHVVVAAGDR